MPFLKNTASQFIGAQMTALNSGGAYTNSGGVLAYLRADTLAMQLGAVNSGICIPNSYGLHHYIPAQSETNFGWMSFTFVGSGAANVTAHVYPAIGDAYAPANSAQAQVNSLYALVGNAVSSLSTQLGSVDTRLSSAATQIGATFTALASVQTGVNSLLANVASNGVAIGSANTSLGSLHFRVSSLDVRVQSLAIGAGTDPWNTPLPGAYGAGTAGSILGSTVNSAAIQTASLFALVGTNQTALVNQISSLDVRAQSGFTQVGSISTAIASLHTRVGSVQAGVDAIGLKTANLPPDPADASDIAALFVIVGTNTGSIQTGINSALANVASISTALASANTGVGSIQIGVNSLYARVGAPVTSIASDVAGVNATVNSMQAKVSSLSFGAGARLAVDVQAVNSDTTAAANMGKTTRAIVRGVVNSGTSNGIFAGAGVTPTAINSNQWNGLVLKFDADTLTTGLRGQGSVVLSHTAGGSTPTFGISSLTTAPASGDTWSVN